MMTALALLVLVALVALVALAGPTELARVPPVAPAQRKAALERPPRVERTRRERQVSQRALSKTRPARARPQLEMSPELLATPVAAPAMQREAELVQVELQELSGAALTPQP